MAEAQIAINSIFIGQDPRLGFAIANAARSLLGNFLTVRSEAQLLAQSTTREKAVDRTRSLSQLLTQAASATTTLTELSYLAMEAGKSAGTAAHSIKGTTTLIGRVGGYLDIASMMLDFDNTRKDLLRQLGELQGILGRLEASDRRYEDARTAYLDAVAKLNEALYGVNGYIACLRKHGDPTVPPGPSPGPSRPGLFDDMKPRPDRIPPGENDPQPTPGPPGDDGGGDDDSPWPPWPFPDDWDEILRRLAYDPNDILGPEGHGPEHLVAADATMEYTVRFENDPDLANAPAQSVRIRQTLDPDLDPRTFRLGQITIGPAVISIPGNRAFFAGRIDLRASLGIDLEVVAGVDATTGEAFWDLSAIDPATGRRPSNPDVGMLPVNFASPEGEGSVSYTVRPRAGSATGTVIDAQARIVFDQNEPIDTPAIFHTLDADRPASTIEAMNGETTNPRIPLRWGGQDAAGGSALRGYSIYVSIDGGPFRLWRDQTTNTEDIYVGDPGHTYSFVSRAIDNAGNVEPERDAPDATIRILSGDATRPEAPTGRAFTPDTGVSPIDGLTNTGLVTITGQLGEAGLAVRVFDETNAASLGDASVSGTTFTLALNLAEGTHRLRITAENAAGNVSIPRFLDIVVDRTGPEIVGMIAVAPDPRNTPVMSIDVVLSEPIDPTSFDYQDLMLTRDGGPNLITSRVTVTPVAGTDATYRISGLTGLTQADGSYTLAVIGAGLLDRAGNAGTLEQTASWLMDTTPPTSAVGALPKRGSSLDFAVSAAGSDPGVAPSGIRAYDL